MSRNVFDPFGFRRKTGNVERRLRHGLQLAIGDYRIAQGRAGRYRRTE